MDRWPRRGGRHPPLQETLLRGGGLPLDQYAYATPTKGRYTVCVYTRGDVGLPGNLYVAYTTIGGTGFGSSKSTSSVKFGTKLAYSSSTSWTNVKVKAKVPTLSKGKTTITVTTRGGTSNSYTFTVK